MSSLESSIFALIKLLGDDHLEVVEAARAKLVELGGVAVSFLEKAVLSNEDSKIRVEAKQVIEEIRLDSVRRDWADNARLSDERLDLERSVFLLARVCYPQMRTSEYQTRLDRLAQKIRRKIRWMRKPESRLIAMSDVLFDDEKFQGNWADYFDPQNSYLNSVLDRKMGIPISLSVLYLLLAQRLRIPMKGVGIPGHFMVKYQDEQREIYLDPFNGGRMLTRPECVQFILEAGFPYQAEFMEGIGTRDILGRMLRNLILIYLDRHEQTLEKTLARFLELLYVEAGSTTIDDGSSDEDPNRAQPGS